MKNDFWHNLKKPIIGLSPMDGITDAAFRYMVAKYGRSASPFEAPRPSGPSGSSRPRGKPDVIFTEFVNVEGLARGAVSMLKNFIFNKIERPIIAQIYGIEAESFYKVALMACYLGFDGIDINMGCPAHKVARRNSGAGLMRVPEQAKKIIRIVKKATEDWCNGITLEKAEIRPKIISHLKSMKSKAAARKLLPVSVKTRTGIDSVIAEEWVKHLLEEKPAVITMHGRTLKQMYSGEANWEVIGKVAKIVHKTDTLFLGNGDIKDLSDARKKIKKYGTDGALIGRAVCGNPWFFSGYEPNIKEKFKVVLDHSRCFEEMLMDKAFFPMRKHLAWYCRGFDGAKELRKKLMQTNSSDDVATILNKFLKSRKVI